MLSRFDSKNVIKVNTRILADFVSPILNNYFELVCLKKSIHDYTAY